jgi:hypothetical protein
MIYIIFMSVSDTIDRIYYALRTLIILLMILGIVLLLFDAHFG